jgi:ribosomal-protein-alanine N-acetyltransferase
VDPPKTAEAYDRYLASRDGVRDDGFLICERSAGRIVGVVNLNVIVRGFFQSAFLGYYVGAPYAGQGYMTEGLRAVVGYAFGEMGLHRVEANVRPENLASIAVVKKAGFRKEGFSPRYLKVCGEWRDHERWALLADEAVGGTWR